MDSVSGAIMAELPEGFEVVSQPKQAQPSQAPAVPEGFSIVESQASSSAPLEVTFGENPAEGSILDPLASGLGFGFTDEALAGMGTAFALVKGDIEPNQVGEMYEGMRTGLLEQRQSFAEDHPVQDFLAEIAPMIVGGLPKIMEQYASKGLFGAGMVGGGEAGLYGAGTAEGDGIKEGDPINVPFTDIQIGESPIDVPARVEGAVTEAPIGVLGGAGGAKVVNTATDLIQNAATKKKLVREGRAGTERADLILKDPSKAQPTEGMFDEPSGLFEVSSQFMPNQPRVVKLKSADKAFKQQISKGTVARIAKANKSTRDSMKLLTKRHYQQLEGISDDEAYGIIGDEFSKRLTKVQDTHKKALNSQKRAVQTDLRGIKGEQLANSLDNFADDLFRVDEAGNPAGILNKNNISVNDKGSLDFSQVPELNPLSDPSNQATLNKMWSQYKKVKNGEDLHKLRQDIDKARKNPPKGLAKVDDVSNNILKQMRGSLRNQLIDLSDDYAEANGVISRNIAAFEKMEDTIPALKKIDFNDPDGYQKAMDLVANKSRSMSANTDQGIKMRDMIDTFDNLSAEYGGKFDTDIKQLSRYFLDLKQSMGTTKPASFAGEGETFVKRGVEKAKQYTGLDLIKSKQLDITNRTKHDALLDVIDEANKRQK